MSQDVQTAGRENEQTPLLKQEEVNALGWVKA
jgi:hypothetical protein